MRLVVVGGGISGLAAAWRLRVLAGPAAEIIVVEGGDRLGGKIRTEWLGGLVAEAGAETFLMRERGAESAALLLARSVGLTDDLVHPATLPATVAVGGVLHPIPAGTLLGVPAKPSTVEGLAAIADLDQDAGRPLLDPGEDVAVGTLVRARFGDQIVDRLVDPMLGGVYAGSADSLSLAATLPAVHAAAAHHHTLAGAVTAAMSAAPRVVGSPIFVTVRGGLGRFVEAIATAARADVRLGTEASELTRTSSGWRIVTHSAVSTSGAGGGAGAVKAVGGRGVIDADAVVLAVPAGPAAELLSGVDPAAARVAGVLDYASVALVTLALPADTALPAMSGFLVPAVEGYAVKAATFFTSKWPHLRQAEPAGAGAGAGAGAAGAGAGSGGAEPVLLRASVGRYGDTDILRRSDPELVDLARHEVGVLTGRELPAPIDATVSRWDSCLPQYGVGHVARVVDIRGRLPRTLALAGAAYDGVGIAACVRSGQAAADAAWAGVSAAPGAGGLGESSP